MGATPRAVAAVAWRCPPDCPSAGLRRAGRRRSSRWPTRRARRSSAATHAIARPARRRRHRDRRRAAAARAARAAAARAGRRALRHRRAWRARRRASRCSTASVGSRVARRPTSARASRGTSGRTRACAAGSVVGRARAAAACMDLSDGLADAARQMAAASRHGRRDRGGVAAGASRRRVVGRADRRATLVALAVAGGEDYELLFAVRPRERRAFKSAARHCQRSADDARRPPDRRTGRLARARGPVRGPSGAVSRTSRLFCNPL